MDIVELEPEPELIATKLLSEPMRIVTPPTPEPEPDQIGTPPLPSPAPKRRIAPTLITTEIQSSLATVDPSAVLIPPPTLSPQDAREQLRSAFEESRFSQFKPFRTFTRRRLAPRLPGDSPYDQPPQITTKLPDYLTEDGDDFWFCRHASFKQDHLIAMLEEDSDESPLVKDMLTMQSWMWRYLQTNTRLIRGDYDNDEDDDDDEVLPVYGESDEDEGAYSDSFMREIQTDQLDTSKRRKRLETVEQERVAEVRRIMQHRQAQFAQ
ncbi:hypothetical protein IWW38_001366, partial [Coemansia aciculifera]